MRKVLLLLLLLINCGNLLSYYPEWTQYTSGNRTSCLLNDGDNIWIGTTAGLVKMNIHTEETNFYNNANTVLPDNKINCLAMYNNKLYIGTDYGFATYENGEWELYDSVNSNLHFSYIRCFFVDKDELWVGTYPYGITKITNDKWTFFENINFPNCIYKDKNLNIWVGNKYGKILKFDGNVWINCNDTNAIIDGYSYFSSINTIISDTSGNIWVGGLGFGILKYDGNKWKQYKQYLNAPPWDICKFILGQDGTLWVNSVYGEIRKYSEENDYWYFKFQISPQYIRDMCLDNDGNFWLSDIYYGIFKHSEGSDNQNFDLSNSGIRESKVTAVAVEDSKLWIGLHGAYADLIMFENGYWSNSYEYNPINYITIDKNGNKWLGCYYTGMVKFDGINNLMFDTSNSPLLSDRINCIAMDKDNSVWIATEWGGLAKYNGFDWEIFTTENSPLITMDISCIAVDELGNKWIGTRGGGLLKYDNQSWEVFDTYNSGLPDNYINSIKIINNKDIWIGTYESGLVNFKVNNWIIYDTSNSGIPDNHINTIETDKYKNIWFGCGDYHFDNPIGLVKFDGTNWNLLTKFNSGLPDNTINSIAFDSTDNMWIATDNGLAKFKYLTTDYHETPKISDINLIISPNPSGDIIQIYLANKLIQNQSAQILIYNTLGELIIQQNIDNQRIYISDLPSGIYFVKVGDQTAKFIKI